MNWEQKHIGISRYTRPGIKLSGHQFIVMHYTANPGAGAMNHFHYFSNLTSRFASAHLFVDRENTVEIIPLSEVAYHAGDTFYNYRSIGVELCIEKDGSFHADTLKRAVLLVAELCEKYGLDPAKDIIRHYDVTKKICPKAWVDDPAAFNAFKDEVKRKMRNENEKNEISVWAKASQKWAIENGISDGTRPKDNVTREELWAMLHRFSNLKGGN